jgi:hypothetical protein
MSEADTCQQLLRSRDLDPRELRSGFRHQNQFFKGTLVRISFLCRWQNPHQSRNIVPIMISVLHDKVIDVSLITVC